MVWTLIKLKLKEIFNAAERPDPQAFYIVLQYCIQPMVDHLYQHVLPTDVEGLPQAFDCERDEAAQLFMKIERHLQSDPTKQGMAWKRLRMPARHGGMALRSRHMLQSQGILFLGQALAAFPQFIDRKAIGENGRAITIKGAFPHLVHSIFLS